MIRGPFHSGVEALDRYLRTQATQDARRRIAACFVAIEVASGRRGGFYTIASASIPTGLPVEITKRLPRCPSTPAVRIGRLPVDLDFRGRGMGAALLPDAIRRVLQAAPAVFALPVDAKDDGAVTFYRHHGFEPLTSQPRRLFLPVATAEKLLLVALPQST